MPWHYDLFVMPVEARWRVSVSDGVSIAPERLCDVNDRTEALRRAREFIAEVESLGDEARLPEEPSSAGRCS